MVVWTPPAVQAREIIEEPYTRLVALAKKLPTNTERDEARWIVDEIARIIQDPAHDGRDIGVISLIVAGFVLANLFLLSVKERTKEIGIRKVLGGGGDGVVTILRPSC